MAEALEQRPARPARPSAPPVADTETQNKKQIKALHDEAYKYIQQGLTSDEQNRTEQAVTLYTNGLRCIDKALDIPYPQTGEATKKMVQKMKRTKTQIQTRVNELIQSDAAVARAIDDPPPSYDNATTPESEFDFLFVEDEDIDSSYGSLAANAEEILKIEEGVQIFYITPEGYVSAPSYPAPLGIYKFSEQQQRENGAETPPAFLRVGDWTYPLVPGSSPVLQSNYGAYVFPDVASDTPGSAVGLIIPETLSADQKAKLNSTLSSLTAMRTQTPSSSMENIAARQSERVVPPRAIEVPARPRVAPVRPREAPRERPQEEPMEVTTEEERTSTKISKGIVTAAEWIAWGLGKGAEKAGELARAGSAKLKERLEPESQPAHIDPRAQKGVYYARQATGVAVKVSGFIGKEGVYYARQATGVAVKVSGFIVKKLGEATLALARELAPGIRKQGEKLLPENLKSTSSKDGRSKMDDAVEVATGGLRGFGLVYLGLESAAKSLFKSLADETVHVVRHKYGDEAGVLADNSLYTAGNTALAGHNLRNLGVKAIAKRAAKDAGKALVEDYAKQRKVNEEGGDGAAGVGVVKSDKTAL